MQIERRDGPVEAKPLREVGGHTVVTHDGCTNGGYGVATHLRGGGCGAQPHRVSSEDKLADLRLAAVDRRRPEKRGPVGVGEPLARRVDGREARQCGDPFLAVAGEREGVLHHLVGRHALTPSRAQLGDVHDARAVGDELHAEAGLVERLEHFRGGRRGPATRGLRAGRGNGLRGCGRRVGCERGCDLRRGVPGPLRVPEGNRHPLLHRAAAERGRRRRADSGFPLPCPSPRRRRRYAARWIDPRRHRGSWSAITECARAERRSGHSNFRAQRATTRVAVGTPHPWRLHQHPSGSHHFFSSSLSGLPAMRARPAARAGTRGDPRAALGSERAGHDSPARPTHMRRFPTKKKRKSAFAAKANGDLASTRV